MLVTCWYNLGYVPIADGKLQTQTSSGYYLARKKVTCNTDLEEHIWSVLTS